MTGVVRLAERRDLVRLEAIENAADSLLVDFLQADRWDPAPDGDSRVETPGFVLVVSESKDLEAVGFVHVIEMGRDVHLEQLSVLPSHARRGLGRSLVMAAMAEAKTRGYGRMSLRTYAYVPWNAPFYASCGFVESQPETPFQRQLTEAEKSLGLNQHGQRIQMTARLN